MWDYFSGTKQHKIIICASFCLTYISQYFLKFRMHPLMTDFLHIKYIGMTFATLNGMSMTNSS